VRRPYYPRHAATTESAQRRDYIDLQRALAVLRAQGADDLADELITASLNRAVAAAAAVA
jgi:hypothetical protein